MAEYPIGAGPRYAGCPLECDHGTCDRCGKPWVAHSVTPNEDVAAPPIDPPDGDDTWRPDEVGLRDEIAVLLERGPGDLDERLERSRALADTIMPVVLAHIGAVLTEEREPRPVRQSPEEVLAHRLFAAFADRASDFVLSEPGVWSLALSLIDALAAHDYAVVLDVPGQDANKSADDAERRAEWARVVIGK